jgi:hypothetical protein
MDITLLKCLTYSNNIFYVGNKFFRVSKLYLFKVIKFFQDFILLFIYENMIIDLIIFFCVVCELRYENRQLIACMT